MKKENNEKAKRYEAINGLRAYAAIGIIVMHVFKNSVFDIPILESSRILPFFNDFVFLFMMISGFGMCCGYYERILKGTISISEFYEKRYKKIWPYFTLLVCLELVLGISVPTLLEAFADFTLMFALLPNANISVIGVGWTLGIIFLFYMLFPFFCYWLKSKKRAWLLFSVSIIYNVISVNYFLDDNHVVETFYNRTSFIYCMMFFCAGGLIFLYKEKLEAIVSKHKWLSLFLCWIMTIMYLTLPSNINESLQNIFLVIVFSMWLTYALGCNSRPILNNLCTKFLNEISMEIYLSHMIVFRILDKLQLSMRFGTGWFSYILICILVISGTIVFALCVKKIVMCIESIFYVNAK